MNPQILNNSVNASTENIYCIRVPKCGSISFSYFINTMGKINKFRTRNSNKRIINASRLSNASLNIQKEIATKITSMKSPAIYVGNHHPFVDFKKFNLPQPIYITFVRDPIERVISWYYYVRTDLYNVQKGERYRQLMKAEGKSNWYRKTYEACILQGNIECQYLPMSLGFAIDHRQQSRFFCGNEFECMIFDSESVIQRAKKNVEKYFTVVGTWDQTNITLTVLENYLPRYFKGAMEAYYENSDKWKVINQNGLRPKVKEEIKDIVRKNFTWEIDFYQFCMQRLYKQYIAIKIDKLTESEFPDTIY